MRVTSSPVKPKESIYISTSPQPTSLQTFKLFISYQYVYKTH